MPDKTDNPGRKVIISIGGNAIIRRGGTGAIEEQFANTESACRAIAGIAASGAPIIITHGNGPIVGNIVIRNEAARDQIPPMPLYICDADSEGGMGFMIQLSLYNRLVKAHNIRDVVAVVTQVVVDPADMAFSRPTKPVGPYYSAEEAKELTASNGWIMAEGAGGEGFRRVVPSPRPLRVVESGVIGALSERGVIVIAAGGGGVPVLEGPDGTLKGVDAVVDKDLTTALLAGVVSAELFINLTEIDMVYERFGTPEARGLGVGRALLDAAEAWGRQRGCAAASLYVTAGNSAAEELYRSAGYEPTGVCEPLRAGSSLECVQLAKEL